MIPNVGDVYCVYAEKSQQYTACQVAGLKETRVKLPTRLPLFFSWIGLVINCLLKCSFIR